MSKYTIELRNILKSLLITNNIDFDNNYNDIISKSRCLFFNFDYPLEPIYKPQFEIAFLKNFYMQEIGTETFELFKLKLDNKLNLISDKYNSLYLASEELKAFDISDYENESTISSNTSSTDVANLKSELNSVNNDTPFSKLDTGTDYASNITNNKTNSENENNSSANSTSSSTSKGRTNQKATSIENYRKAIKNTTSEFLTEFDSLFMLLY